MRNLPRGYNGFWMKIAHDRKDKTNSNLPQNHPYILTIQFHGSISPVHLGLLFYSFPRCQESNSQLHPASV
jgi:hypothetical protein